MTDTSIPPETTERLRQVDDSQAPQAPPEGKPDSQRQGIFDERFGLLTDGFGKACDDNDVATAIAIVRDPEFPDKPPHVYFRGHPYEVAKILALVLRRIKSNIAMDLEA